MKLGLSIGYSGAELKLPVDKVLLAERLGFASGPPRRTARTRSRRSPTWPP